MIGAGPAGLTYASLVADGNKVTVFEKTKRAGGSFRYAGKAPLFQEVEASDQSFARYIDDMTAACKMKGVVFRFATDVTADPERADAVRPYRDRDRRRLSLRPRPLRRLGARQRRRALARHRAAFLERETARLVLLPGAARHRRSLQARWRAPDRPSP